MGQIKEELTLIDKFTATFNNFLKLGQSSTTKAVELESAVQQMTQASITSSQATGQSSSAYQSAAESMGYWTDKVGSFDRSLMESIYTTQELVEQGYKTADALAAEQEAARQAAIEQERLAEATRRGTQEQQYAAQLIQGEATDAYRRASEVISAGVNPIKEYEQQLKKVENSIKSTSVKLQEATNTYNNLVTTQGAATQAAEKQSVKVEELTAATNDLLQTQSSLKSQLAELTNAHNDTTSGINNNVNAQSNLTEKLSSSSNGSQKFTSQLGSQNTAALGLASGGLSSMLGKLIQIAAAYITVKQLAELVSLGMKENNYEIRFQAVLNDDAMGTAAMEYVRKVANDYGRATSEVAKATADFMKLTGSSETLDKFNAITDKLAMFSDNNDFSQMSGNIQRAFMSGELGMLSSATNISKKILSDFQVGEFIKTGQIDKALDALEKASEVAGMTSEAYNKMLDSPQRKWDKFVNNMKNGASQAAGMFVKAFAPAFDKFNEWMESDRGKQFFYILEQGAMIAGVAVGYLVDGIIWLVNVAMDNLPLIAGLFIAAGVAAVIAGVAAFISWVAATWPILIIIGLIALYIVGLYKMIEAYNQLTGSAVSATGIIMGALFTLAAFIYNRVIVFTWNAVAAFVNFLGNVFNNPVAAIKMLFYDLAVTVLGYIANMASGIESLLNSIPGVSVTITSSIDGLYSQLKAAREETKNSSGWQEIAPQLEQWDFQEAATQGYQIGQKIDDTLSNFSLDDVSNQISSFMNQDFGFGGEGGDIGNVGSVGEVGKIKNDVNLADEDLKMLVDLAERQYVAQVNVETNSPIVNMKVDNYNSNQQLDADELANQLNMVLESQAANHTNTSYKN